MPDVAVVGSGPNGLAAAVTMARAGLKVHVYEAAGTPGGGLRTSELMQPGHLHDICSAVQPMALASPFFRAFELSRRVDLITPELSFGSPLDGGRAALAYHSLDRTVAGLGRDGPAYRRLMAPLVRRANGIADFTLNQLLRIPHDPIAAVLFGLRTLEQGSPAWGARFREELAPALLTGVAAHSVGRLPSLAPSGAGLMLGTLAHAQGWPIPVGGSASIARAMIRDIEAHGGTVETGRRIGSLEELPAAKATLLDIAPPALLRLAGDGLPAGYRRQLESYRFGNAACKVDFILSGPVPWEAAGSGRRRNGPCRRLARGDGRGRKPCGCRKHPERPYVLVSQPSGFDSFPRSGGTAYPVDLLPRPDRFNGRYGGGRVGPAGTVRPGFQGPCGPSPRDDRGRACRVQRELRRRRLRRRAHGPPRADPAASDQPRAVAHAPGRCVPVLLINPARSRSDRHARLPCCQICAQGHIRPAAAPRWAFSLPARKRDSPACAGHLMPSGFATVKRAR